MELIDYTNKWVTGEIMEDLAMIAGGVICLLLALVAWRWGTSESARAIILPLTVVAVILIALGGSLAYSNHTRQKQFVEQYQESPEKFLESEKARGRIHEDLSADHHRVCRHDGHRYLRVRLLRKALAPRFCVGDHPYSPRRPDHRLLLERARGDLSAGIG